jgi:hypothetical protein
MVRIFFSYLPQKSQPGKFDIYCDMPVQIPNTFALMQRALISIYDTIIGYSGAFLIPVIFRVYLPAIPLKVRAVTRYWEKRST